MKCLICKTGSTKEGHSTVTFEQNGTVVVIKKVPAKVCENCGEDYVDEKVAEKLLAQVSKTVGTGVQIDVRDYVVA
jgi:YgiT-type zinc finger domain-containing protein